LGEKKRRKEHPGVKALFALRQQTPFVENGGENKKEKLTEKSSKTPVA